MGISFQTRDVWKGPGRPPRRASATALRTCRETARTKTCAVLEITTEVTTNDIKELLADLRAAERELGGKVSVQTLEDCVRWYWTPARKAEP